MKYYALNTSQILRTKHISAWPALLLTRADVPISGIYDLCGPAPDLAAAAIMVAVARAEFKPGEVDTAAMSERTVQPLRRSLR
jgi:hypothetical protein